MSARREARERCLHMLYRVFPKERTRTDINWPGLIDGFVNIILGDDEPPVGKHFQRTDSGRAATTESAGSLKLPTEDAKSVVAHPGRQEGER